MDNSSTFYLFCQQKTKHYAVAVTYDPNTIGHIIIIIIFYHFGTGRRSQKVVKPVRCDYLKPWGEPIRVGQLINFESKKTS